MAVRKQFGTGVAWMAFGNWTEQVVNFIVFVLLARILNADAFGLLAMASVVIVLAEFLVRETLTETLISSDAPGVADFNAVFWLLLAVGGGLTVLVVVSAGLVARAYGHPDIAPLTIGLAPTIPMIAATAVPVAILRREMAFRSLSLRAIAGVVAGGLTGVGMALAGYGVWALIGQRLAQVFTNILVAWIAVPWRPGRVTSGLHLRRTLAMGGQVMALRASELAITQVPTVILGVVLGPTATGLYSVAWRLIETASFLIVTPLRMAAQPAFAALRRGGGQDAAHLLTDISRISGFLAFPAFAGIAAISAPLLSVLFGRGWDGAALPLAILAVSGAYFCIEKVQLAYSLAAGRAAPIAVLGWITVITSMVLCGLLVRWEMPAVAAGFVLSLLLVWPFRFAVVARLSGAAPGDLVLCHAGPVAASAVMYGVVVAALQPLAGHSAIMMIAIGILAGIAVYAALTLVFMRDRLRLLQSFVAHPDQSRDK